MTAATDDRVGFEYFVLRCVPRIERGEYLNVGVVVHCAAHGYLAAACRLDATRLGALMPDDAVDTDAVTAALDQIVAVCAGDPNAGPQAHESTRFRFGWLGAPRSTVVQPGPIHAGLTDDPSAELARLRAVLVD